MSYEEYAARVPAGKLDLVLDEEHGGVDIHLGEIADATDEWDTVLAPHMGLTEIELRDIRSNHRDNRAFQRYILSCMDLGSNIHLASGLNEL